MNEQSTTDAAVEAAGESSPRTTALAVRAERIAKVTEGLEMQTPRIEAYLAKLQQGDSERFRMAVLEALSKTPALLECTSNSIVQAALEAAQLGLEPTGILGGAWMVPYKTHGRKEAKLIVGYRGYIDLIHRAGAVKSIEARVVYEGDAFDVEFGTQKKIRHVPYFVTGREQGDRRFVYWIAELAGETQFDVLAMTTIEKARKASKASGPDSPWVNWYDEMAKKTAIRRAVAVLPISVYEARRAVQLENEAEEEAEQIRTRAGSGTSPATARELALSALDGGGANGPATQGAAADEQAPEDAAGDSSDSGDEADSGRPVTSEPGAEPDRAGLDPDENLPA